MAELTVDPDARLADLQTRYRSDDALRLDGTVFNVLRGPAGGGWHRDLVAATGADGGRGLGHGLAGSSL